MITVEKMPEGYPGIVPFLVSSEYGELNIEIYEGLEELAQRYLELFVDKPFCNEALEFINSGVDNFLRESNYVRDGYGSTRYYIQYRATALDMRAARDDSVKMDESLSEVKNLTCIYAEEDGSIPMISFVTVKEGKIVSVATVNEFRGSIAEITVNTAKDCRGKGYGASNVFYLSRYLIEEGITPAYCVSRYNRASIALAKKCGFDEIGKFYAASAYCVK